MLHAAAYYARTAPEMGERFYDEIERLTRDIRQQPDRFRLFDPPVRRHFSSVFAYAVLYVDQQDRCGFVCQSTRHACGGAPLPPSAALHGCGNRAFPRRRVYPLRRPES